MPSTTASSNIGSALAEPITPRSSGYWDEHGYHDDRQSYAPGYEPPSARGEVPVPDTIANTVGFSAYATPAGGVVYRGKVGNTPVAVPRSLALAGAAVLAFLLLGGRR